MFSLPASSSPRTFSRPARRLRSGPQEPIETIEEFEAKVALLLQNRSTGMPRRPAQRTYRGPPCRDALARAGRARGSDGARRAGAVRLRLASGGTALNKHSSRSHAMLTIKVPKPVAVG